MLLFKLFQDRFFIIHHWTKLARKKGFHSNLSQLFKPRNENKPALAGDLTL